MADSFDAWAIVEIMGHQTFAGRVTEQTIGGASFVRVDVPASDGKPAFTKIFGAGSIYCITPVTEEIAKRAVAQHQPRAINIYAPVPTGGRVISYNDEDDECEMDCRDYPA